MQSRHAGPAARAIVAVLCLLAAPRPARAFKIDTHVWVAQQVLNDLWPDCRVTIDPFGDFDVDPGACEILKSNASAYRLGSVGPDGFPDLVGGQMTTHPGLPGGWKTDDWLRFLVQRAGEASPGDRPAAFAFALGYLTHAASDIFAHSYVNSYSGDVFWLTDGEIEVELRHMALEDFIRRHTPPLVDAAGMVRNPYDVLALPASFVRDAVILNERVADQYGRETSTVYLAGMYHFWATLVAIEKAAQDSVGQLNSTVGWLESRIASTRGRIDAIKNIQVNVCWPFSCYVHLWPAYCFIDPATCLALEGLEATLRSLEATLALTQRLNDLAVNGILAPVTLWRLDVEEALRQYVIASQAVAVEIMKPDGQPTKPLEGWVCRYASVFAAVPSVFNLPGCLARDYLTSLTDAIGSFRSEVSGKLGDLGWLVDPAQKVQELVDGELKPRFQNLVLDVIGNVAGQGSVMYSLAAMRLARPDAASLDREFSSDSSGKRLLRIHDVAERVAAEMHLTSAGTFDPRQYAVIYDAVVMSKLVLLGPSELNRMGRMAGLYATAYGPDLYTPANPFNVLLDAVQSIDGSNQWQETSLPFPREVSDPKWPTERHYGRAFPAGFHPWQDCKAHSAVFMKIFKGPLVPGIEAPQDLVPSFGPPDSFVPFVPMFPPRPGEEFPLAGQYSQIVDLVAPRPLVDPLPALVAECGLPITAPPVEDNCSHNVTVTTADPTVYQTPGLYQVTWTLDDHAPNQFNGYAGNVATRSQTVDVRDTLPPQIRDFAYSGPLCLWAPNHDWVVLRVGAEFQAVVQDRCDKSARLVVAGATSDQPANSVGDGNTSPDVVVWPDHVCLRAERQGTRRDGRTYSVQLLAMDSSGNSSDPLVRVRVSHDQSAASCPRLDASLLVNEGDPLCLPPPRPRSFGCAHAPAPADAWALLALGLLLTWRRRASPDRPAPRRG